MAKERKPAGDGKQPEPAKPAESAPVISAVGADIDPFGRLNKDEESDKQPGYNAAEPKDIENARKEAGQHRRQDRDFWRMAMSTPERRASLYRFLESCHIYGTSADLGTEARPSDPYRTYFNAGEENIGKRVMLAAMDASTDLYLTMIKEQKELRDAKERKHQDG